MKHRHSRPALSARLWSVLACTLVACQAPADTATLLIPEPTPEQQASDSQENLAALKQQIEQFSRTRLTDDTQLLIGPDAVRIQSEFENGGFSTEFKAEADGDILLEIRISF